MAKNNNKPETKSEHYVPVVYLNNFAHVTNKKGKRKGKFFGFNTETGYTIPDRIPTTSVCCEDWLYEIKKDGDFILSNVIEKGFSDIVEPQWGKMVRLIERKSKDVSSTFNDSEINSFLCLMVQQLIRHPTVIKDGIEIAKNDLQMSSEKAKAYTLFNCVPFLIDSNENYKSLLKKLLQQLVNMHYSFGVTTGDSIICSDNPVILLYENKNNEKILSNVCFPVTSNIVFFADRKYKTNEFFFKMSGKRIKETNKLIAQTSNSWVYSKKPFSEFQKQQFIHSEKQRYWYGKSYNI